MCICVVIPTLYWNIASLRVYTKKVYRAVATGHTGTKNVPEDSIDRISCGYHLQHRGGTGRTARPNNLTSVAASVAAEPEHQHERISSL